MFNKIQAPQSCV